MIELRHEFQDENESVEDVAIRKLMVEKLRLCLLQLDEMERWLIDELFFKGKSERKVESETGIPQRTINDFKRRILNKLKKLMEK